MRRKDYEDEELFYCYKYPHPSVTTDCTVFGFDGVKLNVLLIRRKNKPYKNKWAFPGGFLEDGENAEEGMLRELREETGLVARYFRQFHTFTAPDRDPRERVISIAYYALVRMQEKVKGGDDAAEARWVPLDEIGTLAFDHNQILTKALQALHRQIYFEPIVFQLLPEVFTFRELQLLYEQILNQRFDRRNLHKKMMRLGLLIPIGSMFSLSPKSEVNLYRFNREAYIDLKKRGNKVEF